MSMMLHQPPPPPPPHNLSIPMRYAVLLRDLRLSVPVFDDTATFNADEFCAIFGALKGLQVRMVNFEHQLDKIELGMSKLEHRIDRMVDQLQHTNLIHEELGGDDDDDDDGGGFHATTCSPTHDQHHPADEVFAGAP